MEEEKPTTKKEEKALSTLELARELSAKIEAANKEADEKIEKLNQFKAEELISGKAEAGKTSEKKEEESPLDYANKVMTGQI